VFLFVCLFDGLNKQHLPQDKIIHLTCHEREESLYLFFQSYCADDWPDEN